MTHSLEDTGEIIGILGGMGPAATADFYTKFVSSTPANKDQDHPRVVIWADPTTPDRTSALLGTGPDPTPWLARGIQKLIGAGATIIAIPCNTAHAFLPRLSESVTTPIVSMIDEAAKAVRRQFPDATQIGLLATTGTMESRIYQDAFSSLGIVLLVPDAAAQSDLVMTAIHEIKAGIHGQETTAKLNTVAEQLVDQGAEVLLAGCTEIVLGLPPASTPVPLVDAAQALIDALLGQLHQTSHTQKDH